MQVPGVEKIVINMGIGEAAQNAKILDEAVEELTVLAGQKPVVTRRKNQLPDLNFVKEIRSVQSYNSRRTYV